MIHEHRDKCGRLLANLLRQRRTQLYIQKIKNAQQQIRHLPDQIATEFQRYYQDLYHLRKEAQDDQRLKKNSRHTQ
ncbi:Hypothetical predicted protein, partial [Pelobates cultripes]